MNRPQCVKARTFSTCIAYQHQSFRLLSIGTSYWLPINNPSPKTELKRPLRPTNQWTQKPNWLWQQDNTKHTHTPKPAYPWRKKILIISTKMKHFSYCNFRNHTRGCSHYFPCEKEMKLFDWVQINGINQNSWMRCTSQNPATFCRAKYKLHETNLKSSEWMSKAILHAISIPCGLAFFFSLNSFQ